MIYRFQSISLDSELYQLKKHHDVISVEPRVFDLLLFLIENRRRVVTREELLDSLWQGRVVSDAALSACLKAARKAVGDDGRAQYIIRTIYRRGYQFIASVSESASEDDDSLEGQPLFSLDQGSQINGGCACGEVRFEISQPAIGSGYCHCRMCQRFSGAPADAWVAFPIEAVRFTNKEPKYYRSSLIGQRGFCSKCGSRLTYRLLAPAPVSYIVFQITSLDHPEDFPPTWHGGIESQLPWFDVQDDLPRTRCEDAAVLRKAWESVGIRDPADWK